MNGDRGRDADLPGTVGFADIAVPIPISKLLVTVELKNRCSGHFSPSRRNALVRYHPSGHRFLESVGLFSEHKRQVATALQHLLASNQCL